MTALPPHHAGPGLGLGAGGGSAQLSQFNDRVSISAAKVICIPEALERGERGGHGSAQRCAGEAESAPDGSRVRSTQTLSFGGDPQCLTPR